MVSEHANSRRSYIRLRHMGWRWANAPWGTWDIRLGPGANVGRVAGSYFIDLWLGLGVGYVVFEVFFHSARRARQAAEWRKAHGFTKRARYGSDTQMESLPSLRWNIRDNWSTPQPTLDAASVAKIRADAVVYVEATIADGLAHDAERFGLVETYVRASSDDAIDALLRNSADEWQRKMGAISLGNTRVQQLQAKIEQRRARRQ